MSPLLLRLLFMILLSCPGFAAQALRVQIYTDIQSLDWAHTRAAPEILVLLNVMQGLTSLDSELKPVPGLATSWEVSPDGRTYTFTLDREARWSDGVRLEASQFVAAWRRALEPATRAEYAPFFFDIEGAQSFHNGARPFSQVGIRALDPAHLRVTLARPSALFLRRLYFYPFFPLRPELLKRYGQNTWRPTKLVTIGPYRLDSWTPEHRIGLVRNDAFRGPRPPIERVELVIEPDDLKARALIQKGEIDVRFASNTDEVVASTIGSSTGWRLAQFDALNTLYLVLNTRSGPFTDPHLRRAVALAIDRKDLVRKMTGPFEPADGLIPGKLPGHEPCALAFDRDAARSELAAASPPGTRKPLELTIALESPRRMVAAQALKGQLETLGVSVSFVVPKPEVFRGEVRAGGYSAAILSAWADVYPDAEEFLTFFRGKGQSNENVWSSPYYDSVLDELHAAPDLIQRAALAAKAERELITKQVVVVPLTHSKIVVLLSPRVKKFDLLPALGHLYFSQVELAP